MATETETTKIDFIPHWKKQDQCFIEEKIEMVDNRSGHKIMKNGKPVVKEWPHDKLPKSVMRIGLNRYQIRMSIIRHLTRPVSSVKRNLMITGNYHPSKFHFRYSTNSMHPWDEDFRSSG